MANVSTLSNVARAGGMQLSAESDRAIRWLALLGTPFFASYNILLYLELVPRTHYHSDTAALIISVGVVLLGMYHFLRPISSRFDLYARLVLFLAVGLSSSLLITGFANPFSGGLILIFLAINAYIGKSSLYVSMAIVAMAAGINAAFEIPTNAHLATENLLAAIAILGLTGAVISVLNAQETKRKELLHSQAQERLQYDRILTIINNLSDAAFSTDEQGRILMYNAACLDLLDTNKSLHGLTIAQQFSLTDNEGTTVSLQDILKNSANAARRDDMTHTYEDGETIRLEVTYSPIKGNFSSKRSHRHAGFIVIVRDVTKQKSLEEERDEFISVVSHELRTPITIVEGTLSNVQVMMERSDTFDKAALLPVVNVAHEQTLYLARMVNDLSTLSRAERGVADAPEIIDVAQTIHKLFDEYKRDAVAKKLHLDLDLGSKLGSVSASRLYLEELLQNFITNAIKYTKEGSVTICVRLKSGIITFSVKDTGIGISRSDQAKIYQKFYRSEDYRIRETSGTGLGLYVSAKLAHKLGTSIVLTSRLNHGSSFGFDLPQYQA